MSYNVSKNEQTERIEKYERMLNEALTLLESGQTDGRVLELADELEAYYTGPLWKQDFADDEAGLLPEWLDRGVLSEDGIYDLLASLSDNNEL